MVLACCAEPCFSTSYGNHKITWTRALMDPPFAPRLLKVRTYLHIKHLHSAWVADDIGFLVGDW